MKNWLVAIPILIMMIPFVFAGAPPSLPMEVWGLVNIDGSSASDGLDVEAQINSINYAQNSFTENGYYDVLITGLDSPLTDNSDADCSTHWSSGEACIPCTQDVDCVEGPQDGENVNIVIDGNTAEESFTLESGSVINSDVSVILVVIFTQDLVTGWNLFSLPIEPNSTDIEDVLSSIDGKYDIIWTTQSGVWKSSQDFFNPLNKILHNNSYRIYMNSAGTLNVSGRNIDYTVINVVEGWNIMGYPSMDTTDITDLLAGKNYSIVWTTRSGVWKSTEDFFSPITQFVPGQGYRIYADEAFDITIDNN